MSLRHPQAHYLQDLHGRPLVVSLSRTSLEYTELHVQVTCVRYVPCVCSQDVTSVFMKRHVCLGRRECAYHTVYVCAWRREPTVNVFGRARGADHVPGT